MPGTHHQRKAVIGTRINEEADESEEIEMKFDEIEVREEEIPEEEEEALYLSPLKKQFNHMRNAEREVQNFGHRRNGDSKYALSECKTQPRESLNSDSQQAYSDFP